MAGMGVSLGKDTVDLCQRSNKLREVCVVRQCWEVVVGSGCVRESVCVGDCMHGCTTYMGSVTGVHRGVCTSEGMGESVGW